MRFENHFESSHKLIHFRCGSSKHSLSGCGKREDSSNPLPFASCFVCSGKGHLASKCPQNKSKGVYPNGGSCKLCGETSHLARDCELRKQGTRHHFQLFDHEFMLLMFIAFKKNCRPPLSWAQAMLLELTRTISIQ